MWTLQMFGYGLTVGATLSLISLLIWGASLKGAVAVRADEWLAPLVSPRLTRAKESETRRTAGAKKSAS